MSPEAFEIALYNPQGTHAADHVFTREEAEALHGRARAALRGLATHRTLNGIRSVSNRDYALVRSVRRCGDAQEICSAVRECLDAERESAADPHR